MTSAMGVSSFFLGRIGSGIPDRIQADAGGAVGGADRLKRRDGGGAVGYREGATGAEDAAGGRIGGARRFALEDVAAAALRGVERRGGGQQGAGVGVTRGAENLGGRAFLH